MAKTETKKQAAATAKMEWVIAFVGMAMITISLGFLVYRAITQESRPADLSVTVESTEQAGQGYRADFLVKNGGTETAAAVVIEGELSQGGESVEKSSATLTYAPANSTRRGSLYFTKDPKQHELKIRAVGFEKP